jgi:FdhE protein
MSIIRHKIDCLSAAVEKKPEYAGIVPLFLELYRYLEKESQNNGITFRFSRENLAEKLKSGFSLLSSDDLSVNTAVCSRFLQGVLGVLKQMGNAGDESLDAIAAALTSGQLDLQAIFKSIMERNREVINASSEFIGVPAPLVEYVCEIPLKAALELFSAEIVPEECAGWQEGYCPVCGSRAGMAELAGEEGRRLLSCSACTFRWPFKRLQCPFCGNEEMDKLAYFVSGEGPTRVDSCKVCSRYIKTRDSRQGNADVPLDVEDLLTMHLDLLAAREGLERGK